VTFRFIAAEKASDPIRTLCRALAVSPSGYYAWRSRPVSRRSETDIGLRHAIRVAHAASRGRYGSPRVHRVVRAQGHAVGRNRVIRLMRAEGLSARARRRFRVTTDSQHAWSVPANLVRRQFRPAAPNHVWAADITYLETAEGWLYLAVVLDLFSRRVIGWALRLTLQTDLVCAALHLALGRRQPAPGLVHHSDRGLQYASTEYQRLLTEHGIVPSMSRRGDCWDNAVVESFFSTLKQELEIRRWPTYAAAMTAIADYIDGFYNPVRLHSTLDYQPPHAFEAAVVM
jgi:transposase InsO family protein